MRVHIWVHKDDMLKLSSESRWHIAKPASNDYVLISMTREEFLEISKPVDVFEPVPDIIKKYIENKGKDFNDFWNGCSPMEKEFIVRYCDF